MGTREQARSKGPGGVVGRGHSTASLPTWGAPVTALPATAIRLCGSQHLAGPAFHFLPQPYRFQRSAIGVLGQGEVAIQPPHPCPEPPPFPAPVSSFLALRREGSSTLLALDGGICDSQAIGRSGMGV